LFGWRDRLLFQQLPLVVGAPMLASAPPRQSSDIRPWPVLRGRAGTTLEDQLSRNLITCGIPADAWMPCWFGDEDQVTIADGISGNSHVFPLLRPSGGESKPAIWDVALAGPDRVWLLAAMVDPSSGRRAGGRLVRANRHAAGGERVDLKPFVRLILSATDTSCLLLTVEGQLMEVEAQ
jgi:hypothetical protein